MDMTVDNRVLRGTVKVIQSKSYGHRIMVAAALAEAAGGGLTQVLLENDSEDIHATKQALKAFSEGSRVLDCGESGTTFRFLVPVCAALGDVRECVPGAERELRFTGRGRLMKRPMEPLIRAMEPHGVSFRQEENALVCRGKLNPGEYTIAADVSSQYISGLLFALPLLDGDSILKLTGTVESRPYIDMTLDVLNRFGIVIREEAPEEGESVRFRIAGGQQFCGPASMEAEGDWSNAAFWLAAGALGGGPVTVTGLNLHSTQGDRAICGLLRAFGAAVTEDAEKGLVTCIGPADGLLQGCDIDAKDIPDLVPVLSVAAAAAQGDTRIYNAGRLRMKESDRLATVSAMVKALGGSVETGEDWLIIHGAGGSAGGGQPLKGGTVDGSGDHRIVMSAAVAAALCKEPVTILGTEAVNKSYPGFFEERERMV